MKRTDRGVALIVVLWVMMILTILVLSYGAEVRTEIAVAARASDEVRCTAILDSAIERAIAELRRDDEAGDDLYAAWRYDENAFRGVALGGGRYWLVFGEPDPGDGHEVRFGVRDEASKLNLNLCTREQLLFLPGMTEEMADAIIDWRDEDDEPSEQGAEVEYYGLLETPYQPKNGPFESLEELLLVRDIDEQILWGEDRNRNGILDPSEDDGDKSFPPDDADGELDFGLADYLTLVTFDSNVNPEGEPRLSANEADPEEIRTALQDAGLDPGTTDDVLDYISDQQISSIGDFLELPNVDEPALAILWDYLTAGDPESATPGLININTAPREVLSGLIGLEEQDVEAIISERVKSAGELGTPAWLLRVITPLQLRLIIDQITTRAWQLSVHAVAALDDRPVVRRAEVIIDRGYEPYRIIYRRDLTPLGFPLPDEQATGATGRIY